MRGLRRMQWQTTALGYVVDAIEPAWLLLLVLMALVLTALPRGNQVPKSFAGQRNT